MNMASKIPGVDIGFVEINGQTLRFARMGVPHAERTLLVFNGIGASLETAIPIARRFERTQMLIFDVPGVGGSPTPLIPYRMAHLSRLSRRFLDHLGVGEVDVLGVSWGGAAAQQFVFDNQKRVRSMVLCATSAGMVMVPGQLKVMAKMATPKRYLDPEHMLKIGPDIYGGLLRTNREALEVHASSMRGGRSRGYLYQLLAGAGWTSFLWLPQIKARTLIIMGTDDPLVPAVNGKILARRLPNAELKLMDCGHLFMLTQPEETARMVEDFIHADAG